MVIAYFKLLSQHLSLTEATHGNLSDNSRSLGWKLSPGCPEYKAPVLIAHY